MISLFLATICSASIALVFKFSEGQRLNRYVVTSTNYFAAILVSVVMALAENTGFTTWKAGLAVGIPAGICFFLAFVYYQISVRDSGAGLAGMFGKLGILMPMLMSLILWREFPTLVQTGGILLAICAILVVSLGKNVKQGTFHGALLLLFLFGGMAEFSNKLFQKYGSSAEKSYFLLIVFSVAFLVSMTMTVRNGKTPTRKDIVTGICVGIPNMFSSFFLIRALDFLPTAVVFPVYSAGSMALILILSRLIYGEKLDGRSYGAIAMTMLALVLINLS